MSEKGALARDFFEKGYNCSQAVVAAFAPEMGLPTDLAVRMMAPFGGGMGRLREVCGAFSGMLAVLGALYGYGDPTSGDEKHRLYKEVQTLAQAFREQNGSLICRELLGLRAGASDPKPEARTPEYYRTRRCSDMVECAAMLMEAFIEANPRT